MAEPRISVIIPAYNVGRYIDACLQSIACQTCTEWEAVAVDDGSHDDTAMRIAAWRDPRIRLLGQPNSGVSAARNAGLAMARGTMVMFLDGDDVLHPTALARLSTALDSMPNVVAAFGALWKILENGRPQPQQKPLARHSYPSGDVLAPMIRHNFLANGGHTLIRSDQARAAGGFNPRLALSEDWEFWCRLAARGPFHYIGAPPEVFRLRLRPGSASGGLAADWANHLPSLRAVLDNHDLRQRFGAAEWRKLARQSEASHMWEAGRVNFTIRRFVIARRLMLASLRRDPQPKRVALFLLAQASQVLNRPLASRLRFADQDSVLELTGPMH
jgi:glycosyltransferase involved in cell wall biosynthesis